MLSFYIQRTRLKDKLLAEIQTDSKQKTERNRQTILKDRQKKEHSNRKEQANNRKGQTDNRKTDRQQKT
jgi:hypothetical protein